jgi:hypothetical protein
MAINLQHRPRHKAKSSRISRLGTHPSGPNRISEDGVKNQEKRKVKRMAQSLQMMAVLECGPDAGQRRSRKPNSQSFTSHLVYPPEYLDVEELDLLELGWLRNITRAMTKLGSRWQRKNRTDYVPVQWMFLSTTNNRLALSLCNPLQDKRTLLGRRR